MKILYIMHNAVGDRSFGGAMRDNVIRDALLNASKVDTLVITGGPVPSRHATWDRDRVRRAEITQFGLSFGALQERRQLKAWIKDIVTTGTYDLIIARHLDLALLVPNRARCRMIMDLDDFRKSMPVRGDKSLVARSKRAVRNRIACWMSHRVLNVWYCSHAEDQRPPTLDRTFVPNVIAAPDFTRQLTASLSGRILFVGLLTYAPNWDGLAWFVENVWPRLTERFPAVELHAVGRFDPAHAAHLPQVRFHGFVDDLASEYDRAAVVIAPIRSGAGTQIKVIDAMIHGRPVVVSRFSHAGFANDLVDHDHFRVAELPEDWVTTCTDLLENPLKAEAMAARGLAKVTSIYGIDRLNQAVLDSVKLLAPFATKASDAFQPMASAPEQFRTEKRSLVEKIAFRTRHAGSAAD